MCVCGVSGCGWWGQDKRTACLWCPRPHRQTLTASAQGLPAPHPPSHTLSRSSADTKTWKSKNNELLSYSPSLFVCPSLDYPLSLAHLHTSEQDLFPWPIENKWETGETRPQQFLFSSFSLSPPWWSPQLSSTPLFHRSTFGGPENTRKSLLTSCSLWVFSQQHINRHIMA